LEYWLPTCLTPAYFWEFFGFGWQWFRFTLWNKKSPRGEPWAGRAGTMSFHQAASSESFSSCVVGAGRESEEHGLEHFGGQFPWKIAMNRQFSFIFLVIFIFTPSLG